MTDTMYLCAYDIGALGGVQRVMASLARIFEDAGIRTVLVGVHDSDASSATPPDRVVLYPRASVAHVLRRTLGRPGSRLEGRRWERLDPLGRTVYRRRLARRLRREPGAIVAMEVFCAELLPRRDERAPGRRLAQFHNTFAALADTPDLARLARAAASLDGVLALTPDDAAALATSMPVPVDWIPNPIAFEIRPPADPQPRRLVYAGRLDAIKGIDRAVRAWASIESGIRGDWRFDILGEGPERSSLQQLIDELGVGDTVHLLGRRGDMEAELRASGALVLPSDFEGLPLVLAEAMSQGVPCIATDSAPGVRMLMEGADPRQLVPVGDTPGLAAAITAMISDPGLRAAAIAAGRPSAARFSSATILERWRAVLQPARG